MDPLFTQNFVFKKFRIAENFVSEKFRNRPLNPRGARAARARRAERATKIMTGSASFIL